MVSVPVKELVPPLWVKAPVSNVPPDWLNEPPLFSSTEPVCSELVETESDPPELIVAAPLRLRLRVPESDTLAPSRPVESTLRPLAERFRLPPLQAKRLLSP